MVQRTSKRTEANVFVIDNLEDLTASYRLHLIRGLDSNHDQYYQNRQMIIRQLSFKLQNPVTIIDLEENLTSLYEQARQMQSIRSLVRTRVKFEPSPNLGWISQTITRKRYYSYEVLDFMIKSRVTGVGCGQLSQRSIHE
jgi:hypothetical protein